MPDLQPEATTTTAARVLSDAEIETLRTSHPEGWLTGTPLWWSSWDTKIQNLLATLDAAHTRASQAARAQARQVEYIVDANDERDQANTRAEIAEATLAAERQAREHAEAALATEHRVLFHYRAVMAESEALLKHYAEHHTCAVCLDWFAAGAPSQAAPHDPPQQGEQG